jgi:uncharacterized protein involved in exopolysaccharide biosynthesis
MTDNFGPQPMAPTKEPGVLPEEPSSPPGLDPVEVLSIIWAKRKIVLVLSFGVSILALGIFFLFPNYYRAVATLLPETEKSKLSALGQFADVAQLAGVNIPGSEIARLYPSIVMSQTVLHEVIQRKYRTNEFRDSVDLIHYFELERESPETSFENAYKRLQGLMSASYDNKTGIVTISAEMKEPQLAADVVNAIVSELDGFMRLKKITSASEQVKWIDTRLNQVEADLKKSEEVLKSFREKNRRVIDSPQLLLEQARLEREVQMNSTIFVELKKQYELAKLDEIKNTTVVNILDRASTPIRKSRPKRATNAGVMFLITFAGLSSYFIVRTKHWSKIESLRKVFRP